MPESKRHSTQVWAETLIAGLAAGGVDTVCMSPGSRSTPLVAAVVAHPGLTVHTHVDERGAAFFCLGHARATGRPAVWLTTSGTAVANGLPAVVEASMDQVPMVLLTADRPDELRGTGANQTIHQPGIFGVYPRYQVDVPTPNPDLDLEQIRGIARRALEAAIGLPAGPVHINCPFRKPLEPQGTSDFEIATSESLHVHRETPDLSSLAAQLAGCDTGVVLAGRMDAETAKAAERLADHLSWPLLPDITSQLRLGEGSSTRVSFADLVVGAALPASAAVIQIGRTPVSTRVTRFLAGGSPAVWAVLADGAAQIDPEHAATHQVQDALPACRELVRLLPQRPPARGLADWLSAERGVAARLADAVLAAGLTEPAVAVLVSRMMASTHGLVLASSMPVRDMDTFGSGDRPAVVVSNRGASGIDGTLSTAAGLSAGLKAPVTAVLGDLAFLHDINGLDLIRRHPVTLVVVNNDGGGIFSFLPISARQDIFEPFFGTPHGLGFHHAAELFSIPYHAPGSVDEFREAYRRVSGSGRAGLIEVRTDRKENAAEHLRLRDEVEAWLA